jgi:hypothetical protein
MNLRLTFFFLTLFVMVVPDDANAGMFMGRSEDVYVLILLAWAVICFAPSLLNFLISVRLELRFSVLFSIINIIWSIIYPVAFILPLILFKNGADRYKSHFCNFCYETISTIPYFLFVVVSHLGLLSFIVILNRLRKDKRDAESI